MSKRFMKQRFTVRLDRSDKSTAKEKVDKKSLVFHGMSGDVADLVNTAGIFVLVERESGEVVVGRLNLTLIYSMEDEFGQVAYN